MIDWKRIKRTAIQSASGAGIALVTAISADYSREAVIAAIVQFACTVLIAVLMNINKQTQNDEDEEITNYDIEEEIEDEQIF